MISVIIPVYNISSIRKPFTQMLAAVIQQTYRDLDIILVNDGSTDDTAQILDAYGNKEKRIRIINKENGGVESARRRGISEAGGEYIFHLDQDDLLEKNALEILYNAAVKHNADVTIGQSKHFYLMPPIGKNPKFEHDIIMDHNEFMNQYYRGFFGVSVFPVQIWNKLYRKSFLDSFPEPPCIGMYHEDLNYNLHVLPNADRIAWISDLTHYYRWGGFTTKPIRDLDKVALSCYRIKMDKIAELGLPAFTYSTAVELLNYINSFFYQVAKYEGEEKLKEILPSYLHLDEIQSAIQTVKGGTYRNEHVTYMLNDDYAGLAEHEMMLVRKNRKKDYVKSILHLFIH